MGRSHAGGRWAVIEVLACPMRTLLICICVELLLYYFDESTADRARF
jgi:hypothetical protein